MYDKNIILFIRSQGPFTQCDLLYIVANFMFFHCTIETVVWRCIHCCKTFLELIHSQNKGYKSLDYYIRPPHVPHLFVGEGHSERCDGRLTAD